VFHYLQDCRNGLPALSAAATARDYHYARVFGHRLKGTGSPYGFPALTRFGAAIERAATLQDVVELETQAHQLAAYVAGIELSPEGPLTPSV
jgi:hypothetical protein